MNRSVLIGTALGVLAQQGRKWTDLLNVARRQPECLGAYASGLLADRLLPALCLPGKAFIDVGAHIGSVIDAVGRRSRPSKIIAVEAIPAKVKALRRRFPTVTVHECAVGVVESGGEGEHVPFFIDEKRSGYSSLDRTKGGEHVQEIRVPLRCLDTLIGDEIVDVVKIDVEGAELAALRGAAMVIARDRPTIVFESAPGQDGSAMTAMWDWLDEAGYAVLVPERVAHVDPGLSREGFIEAHRYPCRTIDYFAVARSRRDEVRARARVILGLPFDP